MNNFKCKNCNKEDFYSSYSIKMVENLSKYLNKGKEILCKECKIPLLPIEKPGDIKPNFLKFASSTPEEKSKSLKKRSHDHFKKEIKEKRDFMIKNDSLSPIK